MFQDLALSGGLNMYFPLVSQRIPQPDIRLQGVTTLTTVLNALAIDPGHVWKWPWRWFAESMVLPEALYKPLNLELFSEIARRHKAVADTVFAIRDEEQGSLDNLRSTIMAKQHSPELSFTVAAYKRQTLEGRGGAMDLSGNSVNFSMVGGYHKSKDALLLIDVHPPGVSPIWVPAPFLHSAMEKCDPGTTGTGGWVSLSKRVPSLS